jgi:hypothetical protein
VARRGTSRFCVGAILALTLFPTQARAGDRAEIQELLDRRAAAIVNNDRGAFAGTLARDQGGWRRAQLRFFTRLRRLPLSSYRLTATWERFGDLARDSDRTRYPDADEIAIPVTEERYKLAGYDRRPAEEDVFFTFVKEEGEWLIASDTDLDDTTLFSARHPWDFRPIQFRERGHFLLLEPACSSCATAPPAALSLAEAALERVRRYWTPRWHKRIPVVVPARTAELKRMLQLTFDVGGFVAFAVSSVDLRHGVDYTGHRIVLNPDAFEGRPSGSTLDILAHELVHVATRDVSGPFVPTWVEEGIAEYVGHEGDTAALAFFFQEAAAGAFDGRLPGGYEFTTGGGVNIFRSYQKSYSAVRYFIERWGLRTFIRFYRRLGGAEVAPGLAEYHIDRALRQTIGIGLERFERAWAGSIGSP